MRVAAHPRVQNSFVTTQPEPVEQGRVLMQPAEARMIFIVGADVRSMEWAALALFREGHIPVLGQWFWPLVANDATPDTDCAQFRDPVGERLLGRCDAILRVDGPAAEGDALVRFARARGLRIHDSLEEAIAG